MKYIDTLPEEIKNYLKIFYKDYPDFIDDYIYTATIQKLDGKGQFCGLDYHKIKKINPKYWYSCLYHSIADALMAWYYTHDKIQTIAGLYHDSGTPAFKHTIDHYYNDSIRQESSERSTKEIIEKDRETLLLLKRDNIDINDILRLKDYTILENERPKLCIDRLDGVLHTGYMWLGFWDKEDIKKIYNDTTIFANKDYEQEIGFENINTGNFFAEGAFKYSMALQSNEVKLSLHLMSNILKLAVYYNVIGEKDLHNLSELDIIDRILNSGHRDLIGIWNEFTMIDRIYRTDYKLKNKYSFSIDVKDRYVRPLCFNDNIIDRIDHLSPYAKSLLDQYLNYKDSPYAHVKFKKNEQEYIRILKKVS